MPRAAAWIATAALALAAAVPGRSDACWNAVLATNEVLAGVKDAERILDDGDPAGARARLDRFVKGPQIDKFDPDTPLNRRLFNRVRRTRALALVRLDPESRSDADRKVRLGFAGELLRQALESDPEHPAKLTDLAEALAKTQPDVSRKMLEDLAARDLVTTPYAYAALARMRAAGGDAAGRDEAITRCRKMAKVQTICVLYEAKPPAG